MPSGVLFERQAASSFQSDRERGNDIRLREHADPWRQAQHTAFAVDLHGDRKIRHQGKRRGWIAGDRNQLRPVLLNCGGGVEKLGRLAAVGDRDYDVVRMNLTKASVHRLGGVKEGSERPDRGKQTRGIACDMLRLADSRHVHASSTRLSRANYLCRLKDRASVQPGSHQAQFFERELEESL